jgi:hypothetical protein
MNGSGATAGSAGGTLTSLSLPENSSVYSGCALLPIDFVSFDAALDNGKVNLNWQVEAMDILVFEVQRSTNSIDFYPISRVAGTGAVSYSAVDGLPTNGDNYYRIEAVAIGSSRTYSQVRSVYVDHRASFSLVPTLAPAGTMLTLSADLAEAQSVSWLVLNTLGQIVLSEGTFAPAGPSSAEIPVHTLPRGNDMLQVQCEEANAVFPFVIW